MAQSGGDERRIDGTGIGFEPGVKRCVGAVLEEGGPTSRSHLHNHEAGRRPEAMVPMGINRQLG